MNICIIDDDDISYKIAKALFKNSDDVHIYNGFNSKVISDIIIYLKSDDGFFENIPENTVIILIDNRIIRSNTRLSIIICGLFEKSTITASSINISDKLEFTYCIRRAMYTLTGEKIEQQEIKVISDWAELDRVLALLTAKLLCMSNDNIESIIEIKKI